MAETPEELKVDITEIEDFSVTGTLGTIPLRKYFNKSQLGCFQKINVELRWHS